MNGLQSRLGTIAFTIGFLAFSARAFAGVAVCGNTFCEAPENSCTCPQDCPDLNPDACDPCECGGQSSGGCFCDDKCVSLGDCCENACDVCGYCPGICGQNGCEAAENCSSCPQDCGECTGACCPPDENVAGFVECMEVTAGLCDKYGGYYQGDLSVCYPGACEPKGACCADLKQPYGATAAVGGCLEISQLECEKGFGGDYQGDGTTCDSGVCVERLSDSQKGSLLVFSDVELSWSSGIIAGTTSSLTKDTILSLTNDYPEDVYVQMYFVNGDEDLDAVLAGDPPMLIAESEPGWNWVDCALLLTQDQPTYWSVATGLPAGCQPFSILDPDNGNGPGRPNPEANDGSRVLRGFVLAWAVDSEGYPIRWNHLSGKGTVVDYASASAWEYNAWASQVVLDIPNGETLRIPVQEGLGYIPLDGFYYQTGFDVLLLDFVASGAQMEVNGANATFDTDLTLHPITTDLRQETDGPVTTKANFDIWNMSERKFSGTHRCVTCWDQSLLSNYDPPRTFLVENLQSDKGKARIDGIASDVCDENCDDNLEAAPGSQAAGIPDPELLGLDVVCSEYASLLGVAAKIISFSGAVSGHAAAGSNLVGQGYEDAYIVYDVTTPPGELQEQSAIDLESAPRQIGKAPASDRSGNETGRHVAPE